MEEDGILYARHVSLEICSQSQVRPRKPEHMVQPSKEEARNSLPRMLVALEGAIGQAVSVPAAGVAEVLAEGLGVTRQYHHQRKIRTVTSGTLHLCILC